MLASFPWCSYLTWSDRRNLQNIWNEWSRWRRSCCLQWLIFCLDCKSPWHEETTGWFWVYPDLLYNQRQVLIQITVKLLSILPIQISNSDVQMDKIFYLRQRALQCFLEGNRWLVQVISFDIHRSMNPFGRSSLHGRWRLQLRGQSIFPVWMILGSFSGQKSRPSVLIRSCRWFQLCHPSSPLEKDSTWFGASPEHLKQIMGFVCHLKPASSNTNVDFTHRLIGSYLNRSRQHLRRARSYCLQSYYACNVWEQTLGLYTPHCPAILGQCLDQNGHSKEQKRRDRSQAVDIPRHRSLFAIHHHTRYPTGLYGRSPLFQSIGLGHWPTGAVLHRKTEMKCKAEDNHF